MAYKILASKKEKENPCLDYWVHWMELNLNGFGASKNLILSNKFEKENN